eukprot:CAMPEP_0113873792 /NCGR_PEP_ID=MMETSP0780_2-20120614/3971_1 /TAXON_ID=652834 /ORGANISM="Palpitomonas bilix" /LENGTH=491 /DNA_ID=CAMNT_0000859485 /DNA_START=69 /DNA_END=1544 /DNA_ORIENTATION=- /assembly_acc=CAM_ASM_000599
MAANLAPLDVHQLGRASADPALTSPSFVSVLQPLQDRLKKDKEAMLEHCAELKKRLTEEVLPPGTASTSRRTSVSQKGWEERDADGHRQSGGGSGHSSLKRQSPRQVEEEREDRVGELEMKLTQLEKEIQVVGNAVKPLRPAHHSDEDSFMKSRLNRGKHGSGRPDYNTSVASAHAIGHYPTSSSMEEVAYQRSLKDLEDSNAALRYFRSIHRHLRSMSGKYEVMQWQLESMRRSQRGEDTSKLDSLLRKAEDSYGYDESRLSTYRHRHADSESGRSEKSHHSSYNEGGWERNEEEARGGISRSRKGSRSSSGEQKHHDEGGSDVEQLQLRLESVTLQRDNVIESNAEAYMSLKSALSSLAEGRDDQAADMVRAAMNTLSCYCCIDEVHDEEGEKHGAVRGRGSGRQVRRRSRQHEGSVQSSPPLSSIGEVSASHEAATFRRSPPLASSTGKGHDSHTRSPLSPQALEKYRRELQAFQREVEYSERAMLKQ